MENSNFIRCKFIGCRRLSDLKSDFECGQIEKTNEYTIFINGSNEIIDKETIFEISEIAIECDNQDGIKDLWMNCFSINLRGTDDYIWHNINLFLTKIKNARKNNLKEQNITHF